MIRSASRLLAGRRAGLCDGMAPRMSHVGIDAFGQHAHRGIGVTVGARGGVALPVVAGLIAASALLLAFTQRNLFIDELASMNDYSAVRAHEAAEAGAAWTTAALNAVHTPLEGCPVRAGASGSLRGSVDLSTPMRPDNRPPWGRMLNHRLELSCGSGASTPGAAEVWRCRCFDASDTRAPDAAAAGTGGGGTSSATSVRVILQPGPRPGTILLRAHGCSATSTECVPAGSSHAPTDSAPRPAPAQRPDADRLAAASIAHAELGETLLVLPAMQIVPDGAVTWVDTSASSSDAEFTRQFGMPPQSYRRMPVVHRLHCAADCLPAIRRALDAGWRLIWIDGDLLIDRPLDLTVASGGALLFVDGKLTLDASIAFQGLIHSRGLRFTPRASDARIRGAMIAEQLETDFMPAGVVHDLPVLEHLQATVGPVVPVPGSWHVP